MKDLPKTVAIAGVSAFACILAWRSPDGVFIAFMVLIAALAGGGC